MPTSTSRVLILGDGFAVPVRNLSRFLAGRGLEVHVAGFDLPDLPDPIRNHTLPHGRDLGLLLARSTVRSLVERIRPEMVHAFYLSSYGFAAGGVRRGGPAVISTAMGTDVFGAPELSPFLRPVRRLLAWRAIAGARFIHSVAEHMTARLVELGADPSRIVTFPRGVSLERFSCPPRVDPPEGTYRLLCNRKLEPVYDHATLLRAVASLVPGIALDLDITGEGYLRPKMEAMTRELGLESSVRFSGQIDHARMPSVLQGADVFITASRSDGTSSCLLEALASGCIPVATDIPANRPWLQDGDNGFLFEPGSAESLAGAIRAALRCTERWPEIRRANRRMVEERGSIDSGHARILDLYERARGSE